MTLRILSGDRGENIVIDYMTPMARIDRFRSRKGKMEFFRDKIDQVAGFKFSTYGFQDVIFETK
jgi:hypothetical protein